MLAVDDDEQVLCLWQYRHATQRTFVEIPAGLLDGGPDESPLEAARRELVEEAGHEAEEWTHLATTYASPGISAEVAHIYLARGLRHVGRQAGRGRAGRTGGDRRPRSPRSWSDVLVTAQSQPVEGAR